MEGAVVGGPSVLELDIKELENACKHLERSNVELEAFMKEQDEADETFVKAVEENVQALKIKRERIEELKRLLSQGKKGVLEPGKLQREQFNPNKVVHLQREEPEQQQQKEEETAGMLL